MVPVDARLACREPAVTSDGETLAIGRGVDEGDMRRSRLLP